MSPSEFTEGDKAIIREIAFEVAKVIKADLKADFAGAVELHQATCPIKVNVEATLNQAKGAKVALGILWAVAAALGGAAVVVVGHYWK
jgi:hypothetical protein